MLNNIMLSMLSFEQSQMLKNQIKVMMEVFTLYTHLEGLNSDREIVRC